MFVPLDKNQFTCLDKTEVRQALSAALKAVKREERSDIVPVMKKCRLKAYDTIGDNAKYNAHQLNFSNITTYVNYELDNPYLNANGKKIKQINGLPMGGFVSAQLASVDSTFKKIRTILFGGTYRMRNRSLSGTAMTY